MADETCPMCGSPMHEAFGRKICDGRDCHYMQYLRRKKKSTIKLWSTRTPKKKKKRNIKW